MAEYNKDESLAENAMRGVDITVSEYDDYTNEQGKCPKCQGENVYYTDEPVFRDLTVYHSWECKDCGLTGEECYELSFAGHYVHTEDGTIEL